LAFVALTLKCWLQVSWTVNASLSYLYVYFKGNRLEKAGAAKGIGGLSFNKEFRLKILDHDKIMKRLRKYAAESNCL